LRKLLTYLIFALLLFVTEKAQAQWGQVCVDSGRIQPYFGCLRPEFTVVCGCNNVTYRNDCVAFNQYGVNTWRDGVCPNDLFFFDFWPNIVRDQMTFYLKTSVKTSATIEVADAFGKLMFYRILPAVPEPYFYQTFNFLEYRPGIYFVSVRAGSKMETKKFIKT